MVADGRLLTFLTNLTVLNATKILKYNIDIWNGS